MNKEQEIILQNIRLARFKSGYSQEYMSYKLNISQNAYSRLERGESKLTIDRLGEIAKIFGLTIHDLLPPAKDSSAINFSGFRRLGGMVKSLIVHFKKKSAQSDNHADSLKN